MTVRGSWMLAALLGVGSAACDPGWELRGEVVVDAPGQAERALVVQVFPHATSTDAAGRPVGPDGSLEARLALASRATAGTQPFAWGNLGCPANALVRAWIDTDDSSGLAALVAERTFTEDDEHNLDTPEREPFRDAIERLRSSEPSVEDWVDVSEPLAFEDGERTCDVFPVRLPRALVPAPRAR